MTYQGETALIVHAAEAEPYVSELRLRFDFRAREGVPAHITILHPFVPLQLFDESIVATLTDLLRRFVVFDYRIQGQQRWAENLHCVPLPTEPFIALTKAVWDKFPDYPPYEGRFADIVPHLSVAQGPPALLDEAEPLLEQLMPQGGIPATVRELTLISNHLGSWQEIHRFQLGQRPHSTA